MRLTVRYEPERCGRTVLGSEGQKLKLLSFKNVPCVAKWGVMLHTCLPQVSSQFKSQITLLELLAKTYVDVGVHEKDFILETS
jgi:hypothetical protein